MVKVLKVCEKYKMRTLRELVVFMAIVRYESDKPLTIKELQKITKYPYNGIKKVVYKLGSGRESGYPGYRLINHTDSTRTEGRTKEISLTKRGEQLADKIDN